MYVYTLYNAIHLLNCEGLEIAMCLLFELPVELLLVHSATKAW